VFKTLKNGDDKNKNERRKLKKEFFEKLENFAKVFFLIFEIFLNFEFFKKNPVFA